MKDITEALPPSRQKPGFRPARCLRSTPCPDWERACTAGGGRSSALWWWLAGGSAPGRLLGGYRLLLPLSFLGIRIVSGMLGGWVGRREGICNLAHCGNRYGPKRKRKQRENTRESRMETRRKKRKKRSKYGKIDLPCLSPHACIPQAWHLPTLLCGTRLRP